MFSKEKGVLNVTEKIFCSVLRMNEFLEFEDKVIPEGNIPVANSMRTELNHALLGSFKG